MLIHRTHLNEEQVQIVESCEQAFGNHDEGCFNRQNACGTVSNCVFLGAIFFKLFAMGTLHICVTNANCIASCTKHIAFKSFFQTRFNTCMFLYKLKAQWRVDSKNLAFIVPVSPG